MCRIRSQKVFQILILKKVISSKRAMHKARLSLNQSCEVLARERRQTEDVYMAQG